MKFGQRIGIVQIDDVMQTTGINDALRNSLWNVLDNRIWSVEGFETSRYGNGLGTVDGFSRNVWSNHFKSPVDTRPEYGFQIVKAMRKYFFGCQWYEVYEFIEFVLLSYNIPNAVSDINAILERELAGFRVIDGIIAPVTSTQERDAIEEALAPGTFTGVRIHLNQALKLLADREHPDYRNSIKESISAVESLACELSGNPKATLGDALKVLEQHKHLHPALKKGFTAIYGYTSDADGIRHAMLDEAKIDVNDAKFFLVSCSSFINYLVAKHAGGA